MHDPATGNDREPDRQPDARDLWQAVLRTAVDPIIIIDQDGVMAHVNEATEELFGYEAGELVGRNVSTLMPEPHRSAHDGYLHNYLTTGNANIIGIGREVEAVRADGTAVPVALAVSEIKLDGRSWFTGILHDLTQRRLVEAELREAKEGLEARVRERTAQLESSMVELSRSNRDLEQFAYIASHDLQAPLRNVRQGLELLDDHLGETLGQHFDDEANELRELTVAAVVRMEEMIDGLLSYSRLERGGEPAQNPVDLRLLAEEVIDQMRPELIRIGAIIEVEKLPTVNGDEIQLRQLLQNLLENAYKYRDPERPLRLSVDAVEHGDGMWQISVGDNGIGIDAEQRNRVFDLFRRAHPGYEGVGLGLAICQRIVERHGGDIWIEAGTNGGSVFHFTVPGSSPVPAGAATS
ncbi:MAG: ATP-binding protein [Actinomycetota bacterium]